MESNTMSVKDYLKETGKGTKRATPEHDEQTILFDWVNMVVHKHPELKLMFAIPNGAFYGRHWSVANKMKEEGVKKGVPDVFLAVPYARTDKTTGMITEMTAGLWIEMKAGKNKTSPEQDEWIKSLREVGYQVNICYSGLEAIDVVKKYLSLED